MTATDENGAVDQSVVIITISDLPTPLPITFDEATYPVELAVEHEDLPECVQVSATWDGVITYKRVSVEPSNMTDYFVVDGATGTPTYTIFAII
jgi:hypothetical protein